MSSECPTLKMGHGPRPTAHPLPTVCPLRVNSGQRQVPHYLWAPNFAIYSLSRILWLPRHEDVYLGIRSLDNSWTHTGYKNPKNIQTRSTATICPRFPACHLSGYVMLRLRTSEDRTTTYKSYPGALYSKCYMEIFTHTVPIITSFTWLQPGCKVSPLVRSSFFGQNGKPSKRATL